jgi:uridine kinase
VMRIAVDGIDCAGKSTFAARLATLLQAARLCVDDFLRPIEERHVRGVNSPEGYYHDSFDNEAFRAAVLAAPEPLVADGVFLQRPELADLWDLRIWVDISFEAALERAVVRDAALFDEVRDRYQRRYFPGQCIYLDEVDPRTRADIVVTS